MPNATTSLDVAGQLGGKDAQPVFVPHFKALKRACSDFKARGLPVAKLTYILRMDGEVSTYGKPGVGPIARDGKTVSVDLVIPVADRPRMAEALSRYLAASVPVLARELGEVDADLFASDLNGFIQRYLDALDDKTVA